MASEDDTAFLQQLLSSLQEAQPKLEQAYTAKSSEAFMRMKQFVLHLQKKINEELS